MVPRAAPVLLAIGLFVACAKPAAPTPDPPRSGGETEGETSQPEAPAGDVELGRAMALEKSNDLEAAYEAYQKLLMRERDIGSKDGVMVVLAAISRVQYKLGNFDAAADSTNQALVVAAEIGDAEFRADLLIGLGAIQKQRGDMKATREAWSAAAEQLDALGEHDRAERTRARIEDLPSPATD